jgi:hypothetical protein
MTDYFLPKAVRTMRRSWVYRLGTTIILLVLVPPVGVAGIRTMPLSELADVADVIVIGRVQQVREISSGTEMEVFGQQFPAKVMEGEVVIDKAIKGDPNVNKINFHFRMPISPAGGVGYRGIPNERYRLVFLKRAGSDYDFVSPYNPSFPAVRDAPIEGETATDQVVSQLAAVIRAPQVSREDKLEVIFALQQVNTPVVVAALRSALTAEDKVLQLSIAAALLERNDLSALGIAEAALTHPQSDVPRYIFENLSSAISKGVQDERAIPALSRVLRKAPDAAARRAAAFALRTTESRSAIKPLVGALADGDFEVRYYAVIGLAEITNQSEWRPLMDEFKSNEERYLKHWRDWANAHGTH